MSLPPTVKLREYFQNITFSFGLNHYLEILKCVKYTHVLNYVYHVKYLKYRQVLNYGYQKNSQWSLSVFCSSCVLFLPHPKCSQASSFSRINSSVLFSKFGAIEMPQSTTTSGLTCCSELLAKRLLQFDKYYQWNLNFDLCYIAFIIFPE